MRRLSIVLLLCCLLFLLWGCNQTTTIILPPEPAESNTLKAVSTVSDANTIATEPTAPATTEPTAQPTAESTIPPTTEPIAPPTTESTAPPTTEPTVPPTTEPTAPPTTEPTVPPTAEPTVPPTTEPTVPPTTEPTAPPTTEPTVPPTAEPTVPPTTEPTVPPTTEPTVPPTTEPMLPPTTEPTIPDVYDISNHMTGSLEHAILEELNARRTENGLPALTLDHTMCALAQIRAYECTSGISHTRPDGRSCFSVFSDYSYDIWYSIGENLLYGSQGYTAAQMVEAWMASEGHRSNILSTDFTHTGIGVWYANGLVYVANFFAG